MVPSSGSNTQRWRAPRAAAADLLGEHVVIGKALRDQRAEHALDFEIDLGDEIDRALLLDAHAGAERGDLHIAGADDRFDGGGEECGDRGAHAPRPVSARFLHHPDLHAAAGDLLQHTFVHEVADEEDAAAAAT